MCYPPRDTVDHDPVAHEFPSNVIASPGFHHHIVMFDCPKVQHGQNRVALATHIMHKLQVYVQMLIEAEGSR